jgi:hypothetical protein
MTGTSQCAQKKGLGASPTLFPCLKNDAACYQSGIEFVLGEPTFFSDTRVTEVIASRGR